MADESDDVRLSIGFDTSEIVEGGKVYVDTNERIQQSARSTAASLKATEQGLASDIDAIRSASFAEQVRKDQEAISFRRRQNEAMLQAQAQADAAAAQQAAIASGAVAREYLNGLKVQFDQQRAFIGDQVGKGLMNRDQAKLAGKQNAMWYNEEIRQSLGTNMFTGVEGDAQAKIMAQASGSMKTIAAEANNAGLGLGRLRYSVISLASSLSGVPPILGRVVGSFGTMALGLGPLLALLGVVVALGETWKYVQAPMAETNKIIESNAEAAKHAHDNVADLNRELGLLGQVKLDQPTSELQKLDEEGKKLMGNLGGTASFRTMLNEMRVMMRDANSGNTNASGPGIDSNIGAQSNAHATSFERQMGALNDRLKDGQISLTGYTDKIQEMVKAWPDVQDLAKPFLEQAGAIQGVTDKMATLRASYEQNLAQQKELTALWGSPALAKTGEQLANVKLQIDAVNAGGKTALEDEKHRQSVLAEGKTEWEKYVETLDGANKKFQGVAISSMTFTQALQLGVPAATGLRDNLTALTSAEDTLTSATERAAKAKAEAARIDAERAAAYRNSGQQTGDLATQEAHAIQLANAAKESTTAYERLDAQLKIDTEIKKDSDRLTKEFTDTKTGQLTIDAADLQFRKDLDAAAIRQAASEEALAKARLGNNATEERTRAQNALADAYEKGAIAAKDEAVQTKYLEDMQRAAAIGDAGEKARAEKLAADERDAALRLSMAKEASQQRIEESKKATTEATKQASVVAQQMHKIAQDASQAFNQMFQDILNGGTDIFGKLVSRIEGMFLRMMADLASQKIASWFMDNVVQKQIMGMSASVFTPEMIAKGDPGGGTPKGGLAAHALGYGATILGAGAVGYGVGASAGSYGTAALGGVASGALTGAAIGSVVPIVGTAVGAVIGSVAGLAGGLIGHAAAIRKAKQEFQDEQAKFIDSFQTFPSQFAQQFVGIEDAFKNLQEAAKKAKQSVSQDAIDAKNNAEAKLRTSFMDGLAAKLTSLGTDADKYAASLAAVEKEYQDNVDTSNLLGLGIAGVTKADELRTKELEALKKAQDQQNTADLNNLALRQLRAQGLDDEAAALQRNMELQQAYDDGKSAEYISLLKATQALEAQADAQAKATQAAKDAKAAAEQYAQTVESLTQRAGNALGIDSSGTTLLAQQRAERQSYLDNNASPTQLALLDLVQQLEYSQFVAQQAATKITDLLSQQLTVMTNQLTTAKDALSATTNVLNGLGSFRSGLMTGGNSSLSPTDQYAYAKQQVTDAFNKALGGDKGAASDFSGLANTFLSLSKSNYASTSQNGSDFADVLRMTDQLQTFYTAQKSLEQQQVDFLQTQIDLTQQQLDILKDVKALTQEQVDKLNAAMGVVSANANTMLLIAQQQLAMLNAQVAITNQVNQSVQNGAATQVTATENGTTATLQTGAATQQGLSGQLAATGQLNNSVLNGAALTSNTVASSSDLQLDAAQKAIVAQQTAFAAQLVMQSNGIAVTNQVNQSVQTGSAGQIAATQNGTNATGDLNNSVLNGAALTSNTVASASNLQLDAAQKAVAAQQTAFAAQLVAMSTVNATLNQSAIAQTLALNASTTAQLGAMSTVNATLNQTAIDQITALNKATTAQLGAIANQISATDAVNATITQTTLDQVKALVAALQHSEESARITMDDTTSQLISALIKALNDASIAIVTGISSHLDLVIPPLYSGPGAGDPGTGPIPRLTAAIDPSVSSSVDFVTTDPGWGTQNDILDALRGDVQAGTQVMDARLSALQSAVDDLARDSRLLSRDQLV